MMNFLLYLHASGQSVLHHCRGASFGPLCPMLMLAGSLM